jgi:hypothetical protein
MTGDFVPWLVNHKILWVLSVHRTMEYLEGGAMPQYIVIKKGRAELEAAREKDRKYFPFRVPVEWSADPIGLRSEKTTFWLEPDPVDGAEAMAVWQPLNAETWPHFWSALDTRYNLSGHFPGIGTGKPDERGVVHESAIP